MRWFRRKVKEAAQSSVPSGSLDLPTTLDLLDETSRNLTKVRQVFEDIRAEVVQIKEEQACPPEMITTASRS